MRKILAVHTWNVVEFNLDNTFIFLALIFSSTVLGTNWWKIMPVLWSDNSSHSEVLN